MSRIGRGELAKEGFPVARAANVANTANLANSETGGGSSAKFWQRYSHSEKAKRKRKGGGKKGCKLLVLVKPRSHISISLSTKGYSKI